MNAVHNHSEVAIEESVFPHLGIR
ncbi:MAG: hypothetical protein AVDCRST_MAG93-2183, partial [uncultured Chloroflexia bacterium]